MLTLGDFLFGKNSKFKKGEPFYYAKVIFDMFNDNDEYIKRIYYLALEA